MLTKKVLVANRGEIACRIISTLHRMGIASVAVYSDADRHARHVTLASEALRIGASPAAESYLSVDALLAAVRASNADAVHPGYGFLSENAEFAAACLGAGRVFIGPTPDQLRVFGLKHRARALAEQAGVPLLPGTPLLASAADALAAARVIGYPVMLKSTAGGGGIGLRICHDAAELEASFAAVNELGQKNFAQGGVFLEKYVARARHLEVQVFGDGTGRVVTLGERDCSTQRRNQKVIEETPAPRLSGAQRAELAAAAVRLASSVRYLSAGTVEFVFDEDQGAYYFLEVNTRLQVEHGVTELVWGVDLVEWMVRAALGPFDLERAAAALTPRGHALQVRVYAENAARSFQPSTGVLTAVDLPGDVRVDTWVEPGTEVTAFYDPLLAKVLVHEPTREAAVEHLGRALDASKLCGVETNLPYLRAVVRAPRFRAGEITTRFTEELAYAVPTIDVLAPGTHTTVQDYPGRLGYWNIGVPPSGPMDDLSFRLANRAVGNPQGAPALELTAAGPTLRFNHAAVIAVTGADMAATLDGAPLPRFTPVQVTAGQLLRFGKATGGGTRTYLAVRGGFDVPEYLGSASTFTLGKFGGHAGRCLVTGDVLWLLPERPELDEPAALPAALIPTLPREWELGVLDGPHGAPDFFTEADIEALYQARWRVHFNSSRTGVRLIGPKPQWARTDGGEAGLHPSNIHDVPYAIGAVDFTGDMPIILGPDGPSLGGFVCPVTVVAAELWKLGQLGPDDVVRFVPVSEASALEARLTQERALGERMGAARVIPVSPRESPVVHTLESADPTATYRRAGDGALLVEYGPMELDLRLRFRVHALMGFIESAHVPGVLELTPGIRSLQIRFDERRLSRASLVEFLAAAEPELPPVETLEVPTRVVHLPLSWDDAATRLAIERYMQGVRGDAPWTPSNIEFIRRINGLEDVEDVRRIVFDASYLVLGLGDVYLGAPVATPLDPRHRLVTTKYNPARTWTPENAVGIGGAYLCIYGMEGPGGYQFVGRTVPVFNRFRVTHDFEAGRPWLLRFFDQIRWYEVSHAELLELREAVIHGTHRLRIEEQTFRLADYARFLTENAASIAAFKQRQQRAFEAERERWRVAGEGTAAPHEEAPTEPPAADVPAGTDVVAAPLAGSVWKVKVRPGDRVRPGDALVVLESMKMEIAVEATSDGIVDRILCREGSSVAAGQTIAWLATREGPCR